MKSAFPSEAVFILLLDALILLGWILVLARSSKLRLKVAMLSASAGAWFLGLGLALHQFFVASLNMHVAHPATFSGLMGDALIIAGAATQGALILMIFAMITFTIPSRTHPEEGRS